MTRISLLTCRMKMKGGPQVSVDSEPSWVIERWSNPSLISWQADDHTNYLNPWGRMFFRMQPYFLASLGEWVFFSSTVAFRNGSYGGGNTIIEQDRCPFKKDSWASEADDRVGQWGGSHSYLRPRTSEDTSPILPSDANGWIRRVFALCCSWILFLTMMCFAWLDFV